MVTAVICCMWMIAVFINSKNGNTIQAIEDYDGCVATKYHRKEETAYGQGDDPENIGLC